MGLFRNLAPYMSGDSGETDAFTVLLLSAAAVSSLIPAFLHRVFFDRVIPDRSVEMIFPIMILLILVEITGICTRYFAERQLASGCRRNRHRVRNNLTNRLWSLRVNWFNLYGTGAVTRYFDDAGILGNTRTVYLRDIVGPLIILILLLPSMLLLQPLLTASRILISIPAFLIGFRYLNRDLEYERKIWAVRKRLTGILAEGVRGVSELKTGRGGGGYACHTRSIFSHLGQLEERRRILRAGWEASAAAAGRIGGSVTLLLAVYLVVDGRLSFGSYIAFSILASRFMSALGELLGGVRTLARTGNAGIRLSRLFAEEHDDNSNSVSLVLPTSDSRGLAVAGLTFRYPGSGVILDKLDLKIRRGERVLLSGGSGEGKSTLLSLILGLYSPESGDIGFSGISLVTCPSSARRELVGAALQKPSFFSGTVRENLCLFGAAPSDRFLWRVLESAAADDIVSRLPGGLNAGLRGEDSGLSGGQKQRLAIARLMVHPPPLILLDEPVNSLDRECTERVCFSLSRACEGRTVVFISHGEVPLMPFDRRIFLAGGRIRSSE